MLPSIPYRCLDRVQGGTLEHTPDNRTQWHAISDNRTEQDAAACPNLKGHHFHSYRAARHWLSVIDVTANGGALYQPEQGDPA